MAGAFYTGSQYGGTLTNRFFYGEFYSGWVRSFGLTAPPITEASVMDDQHMGHNPGMTSLQQGPDGFLYGVSLFNDDHILRVDLQ
jgi:glucose/arabinose dehydrogenase